MTRALVWSGGKENQSAATTASHAPTDTSATNQASPLSLVVLYYLVHSHWLVCINLSILIGWFELHGILYFAFDYRK